MNDRIINYKSIGQLLANQKKEKKRKRQESAKNAINIRWRTVHGFDARREIDSDYFTNWDDNLDHLDSNYETDLFQSHVINGLQIEEKLKATMNTDMVFVEDYSDEFGQRFSILVISDTFTVISLVKIQTYSISEYCEVLKKKLNNVLKTQDEAVQAVANEKNDSTTQTDKSKVWRPTRTDYSYASKTVRKSRKRKLMKFAEELKLSDKVHFTDEAYCSTNTVLSKNQKIETKRRKIDTSLNYKHQLELRDSQYKGLEKRANFVSLSTLRRYEDGILEEYPSCEIFELKWKSDNIRFYIFNFEEALHCCLRWLKQSCVVQDTVNVTLTEKDKDDLVKLAIQFSTSSLSNMIQNGIEVDGKLFGISL
ncbi:hypothetical protein FO519_009675 [Halicephalobus sp. NKZ332]|nr:hypothetical protein FO519_009675 [Halicephalobus sp. NKZ332]